jgi:hypothetical protein
VRLSELNRGAAAVRVAHLGWAALGLGAVASVWTAAVTKRRNRFLGASFVLVGVEATALVIGRGDCPLGPVQERLGDPVPLFELFLPAAAARQAIPVLAMVTTAGLVTIALDWPLAERLDQGRVARV